ncbi:hypothetical protein QAD02_016278 [Eretmocerus hayati]|uniref:Uncharacterized protein n=1 Tax=Eretmocerus hayati TaxID=131215 RepID=A0ACC2PBV8_9HYME|nr:hypothetical protein QAD02_016278 [Eretmocerus hayati]
MNNREGKINSMHCLSEESDNHPLYDIGSYVVVEYEQEYFPEQVNSGNTTNGSAEVSVMMMRGRDWAWPESVDQIWYTKNEIDEVIKKPKLKLSKSKVCQQRVY